MHHISAYKNAIKIDIQSRFSDYDLAQHLNNTAYMTYLETARNEGFTHAIQINTREITGLVAKVSIDYKRAAKYGEPVSVLMSIPSIKNSSHEIDFSIVNSNDFSIVYATAQMTQVMFDLQKQRPTRVCNKIREYAEMLNKNEHSDSIMDYVTMQEKIKTEA